MAKTSGCGLVCLNKAALAERMRPTYPRVAFLCPSYATSSFIAATCVRKLAGVWVRVCQATVRGRCAHVDRSFEKLYGCHPTFSPSEWRFALKARLCRQPTVVAGLLLTRVQIACSQQHVALAALLEALAISGLSSPCQRYLPGTSSSDNNNQWIRYPPEVVRHTVSPLAPFETSERHPWVPLASRALTSRA